MRTQMISSLLRARPATLALRASVAPAFARPSSSAHGQETFESFSERYVSFFQSAQDLFEVQRGLNNCFAHDLVPSPAVIESALRAARRVNDYSTAVRILEGVKEKVENKQQYESYLEELKPVREELGESNLPLGIWGSLNVQRPYILDGRHKHKRRAVHIIECYPFNRSSMFSRSTAVFASSSPVPSGIAVLSARQIRLHYLVPLLPFGRNTQRIHLTLKLSESFISLTHLQLIPGLQAKTILDFRVLIGAYCSLDARRVLVCVS